MSSVVLHIHIIHDCASFILPPLADKPSTQQVKEHTDVLLGKWSDVGEDHIVRCLPGRAFETGVLIIIACCHQNRNARTHQVVNS